MFDKNKSTYLSNLILKHTGVHSMFVLYVHCLEQDFPIDGITVRRSVKEATETPKK